MKRILFLFGLLVCLAGMPLTAFADNKTAKQTYETAISDNWKTMLKNSIALDTINAENNTHLLNWQDVKNPSDEAVVKTAKEHHRMIELNNTSLTPGGSRIHAYENDRIILPLCAKYKVPVIMNSDAHFTTAVGEHGRAEALLKELNFPEELIANYHPEILKEYIPDLADFQG